MNKSIAFVGIATMVAIIATSLFFVNQTKLKEQEAKVQEQMTLLMQEQQRMEETDAKMRAEREKAEKLALQSQEARRMAEAQAEKERLAKQEMIDQLNEQLKVQASERRKAEEAQAALASKITALEAAQAESKATLAALEAERQQQDDTNTPDNAMELRKKLEDQQMQLASLSEENESLKEQQKVLEERQMETEEAIVSAGGKIEIPYPEIRSPNAKRREAIYFKERVVGHPTP